ncbi:hypothetical protein LTR56_019329 [Elasticomyces elasticus]|nr:hypothetical protein LTR56_019329 [Elasticomyces elasticus]KAK3639788.1 hypothetical protein LTR22_017296 [Elasticomyces elasticus]KAK4913484.1 hypothetical protein LTR49_018189 [Elasticomyces elasticus]KAK5750924.1 hypothetical protein LTS12_018997 [Elasticomyces elasticus]
MSTTFQAYQPNSSRPSLRACEACYARKCVVHGVQCKARSRKRKASTRRDDEDPQDQQDEVTHCQQEYAEGRREITAEIRTPLLFVRRDLNSSLSPGASITSPSTRNRTSSFLSRAAILGEDFPGIDHSHGTYKDDASSLSAQDVEVLKLQGAFDLPDLPLRQSLLEACITYCVPWMPVIDVASFDVTSTGDDSSLVLLQAVMLSGAIMRPTICSKPVIAQYYRRLKALILSGYESDPLKTLSALCLIQWYTTAAPKDVSTDSPRFWNTYAIGLAHQLGLHKRQSRISDDAALRRRVWFTLYARDCLTSAAHGRPRLLTSADSDLSPLSMEDFADQGQAELFKAYSQVTALLGDLCQLVTRNGRLAKHEIISATHRLLVLLESLPHSLIPTSATGRAQPYDRNSAQLHIAMLTTLIILYRPRSVFSVSTCAAPSITAAFLSFRLFQAIQLRADTAFLGSAFAWYLLVAAIPLLSATRVTGLLGEASTALDGLEASLASLGEVRPAARNNLKSVRAIRRAVDTSTRTSIPVLGSIPILGTPAPFADQAGTIAEILAHYGEDAAKLLVDVTSLLQPTSDRQVRSCDLQQPYGSSNLVFATDTLPGSMAPADPDATSGFSGDDMQSAFTDLFQDETLVDANSWMFRDWMNFTPGIG